MCVCVCVFLFPAVRLRGKAILSRESVDSGGKGESQINNKDWLREAAGEAVGIRRCVLARGRPGRLPFICDVSEFKSNLQLYVDLY